MAKAKDAGIAPEDIEYLGAAAEASMDLASKFQAVITIGNALKGLASVEGARKEREAAFAEAKAKHEGILAAIDTAQRNLDALRGNIEASSAKAAADTQSALDQARLRADVILVGAHSEAEKLLADAKAEAQRVQDAVDASMKAAIGTRDNALAEARQAAADRDASREELAELQAKTDALRKAAMAFAQPAAA